MFCEERVKAKSEFWESLKVHKLRTHIHIYVSHHEEPKQNSIKILRSRLPVSKLCRRMPFALICEDCSCFHPVSLALTELKCKVWRIKPEHKKKGIQNMVGLFNKFTLIISIEISQTPPMAAFLICFHHGLFNFL